MTDLESPISPHRTHPVRQFYQDVVACLTEPRAFFTHRFSQISLSHALAFAIVVNWIADLLAWLTRVVRHESLMDGLLKMRDRLSGMPMWKDLPTSIWAQQPEHTSWMPGWVAEALGVAISPFQTLIRIVMSGVTIWVGVYLLVPKNQDQGRDSVELGTVMRIVALASAPVLIGAILGFLPLGMGTLIANLYGLILLIYALSIRFKISYLRAFGVVVLPGCLFIFLAGCLLTTFGALLFGLGAAFLGGFTK